jgi:hypothetical protein
MTFNKKNLTSPYRLLSMMEAVLKTKRQIQIAPSIP